MVPRTRTLTEHDLELIAEKLGAACDCKFDISTDEMAQVKALAKDFDTVRRISLGMKIFLGLVLTIGSIIVLFSQIRKMFH